MSEHGAIPEESIHFTGSAINYQNAFPSHLIAPSTFATDFSLISSPIWIMFAPSEVRQYLLLGFETTNFRYLKQIENEPWKPML
jgi:hypothetical protein